MSRPPRSARARGPRRLRSRVSRSETSALLIGHSVLPVASQICVDRGSVGESQLEHSSTLEGCSGCLDGRTARAGLGSETLLHMPRNKGGESYAAMFHNP
jgi:hypothetical protein